MKNKTILDCALVLLILASCGGHVVPCTDCEADDAADQDDAPVPDLPCGGADLMTDNLNCGSCGNECIVWYEDTPYAAGICTQGVCGPGWTDCVPESMNYSSCADVCELLGQSCVANGCAGYTGMLYGVNLDGWGCDPNNGDPGKVIAEGCDAPIPWMTTGDNPLEVMCCCDFQ